MNNLKLSSKMHIMVIVSSLVIAIGLAMGLIFQFVSNGFFNFGAEFESYNSVVVEYAYVDYGEGDKVVEICDKEFQSVGVKYFGYVSGDTDQGGEITFKFAKSCAEEKVKQAAENISKNLKGDTLSNLSGAYFHTVETKLGGAQPLIYASIALASAAVFQFLYFVIRYKLTMAFAALLANVHNLALYTALLAITRIPVGTAAIAFGALTVVMTMFGCGIVFDRMRKNLKDEKFASFDVGGQVDTCVGESFTTITVFTVFVAVAAVLLFVLLSIGAMSVTNVFAPVVMALLCALASFYGTVFFTPSVYSRFKKISDGKKAGKTDKKS